MKAKSTVVVSMRDPKIGTKKVPAQLFGPLAVHRTLSTFSPVRNLYVVTHAATGLALTDLPIKKMQAVALAKALKAQNAWDFKAVPSGKGKKSWQKKYRRLYEAAIETALGENP